MAGKMLKAGTFLGKARLAGDTITDDELDQVTDQTKQALVGQKIMEIDGLGAPMPMGVDAATKELMQGLRASFDAYREATGKIIGTLVDDVGKLHAKLDAALGGKPAPKKRK